jgi:hypothetical protein
MSVRKDILDETERKWHVAGGNYLPKHLCISENTLLCHKLCFYFESGTKENSVL